MIFAIITTTSFTQTKRIFHKSHSGKSHTLNFDEKNNFGPGMVTPMMEITSLSDIELQYKKGNITTYPLVLLNQKEEFMKFIDKNDSIIGCRRNYTEYLTHGAIVYDRVTDDYYIYQLPPYTANDAVFIEITDSITSWENKPDFLLSLPRNIYDKNNKQIQVNYTIMPITYNYRPSSPIERIDSSPIEHPIIKSKKEHRKDKKILKQKTRKSDNKSTAIILPNKNEGDDHINASSPSTVPPIVLGIILLLTLFSKQAKILSRKIKAVK